MIRRPPTSAPDAPSALTGFSARDAMFSWLQEIAPYGVFTTDASLRIQSWNRWLEERSGMSAEMVIGRMLLDVFPNLKERRLAEHFESALAGEVSVLSSALHKHLLPFPVSAKEFGVPFMLQTARIAPLPSGDSIIGTITILEDVTQRESHAMALQRQQDHDRLLSTALTLLLKSRTPLPDLTELFLKIGPSLRVEAFFLYLYDKSTHLLRLANASGATPKQREMLSTLKVGELVCGKCAQDREAVILEQLQTTHLEEAETQRAMGLQLYCCFPLLIADRLLGTLSFGSYSRDTIAPDEVTFLTTLSKCVAIAIERAEREAELRDAQYRLREHADSLESKVAERTARLHETIAQLESFSYTVAHDLRAPIRSLKGYSEVLLEDYSDSIPEAGRAMLTRLQRASGRLDALTRDLLKFSKVAREDVDLGPVNVDELVSEITLLAPTLEKALVLQKPLGSVRANRTLLQQCISNLLDNAFKFAKPGGTPTITIRSEVRDAPHPLPTAASRTLIPSVQEVPASAEPFGLGKQRRRIWVEDNGLGIPAHAQDKIFGIFERGAGLDHVEGTGIGLAIVARAMQRMRGQCGVESEEGRGSRFWLELPPA